VPGPVPKEFASLLKMVHIVCANGNALEQTQEFLGEHVVELPVGLDGDVFKPGPTQVRERLGWTKDYWVIGYVGRLAYVKGVDLLAVAFAQIRRLMPQARLLFVGSGEEEGKIRSQLRSELAAKIVHIESDVPHDGLAEWYRAMDLFVMPSRYENYSNAVLEALACGVPFLVSDVGGNRTLRETEGGWVFAQGSTDDLVESINSIAANSRLAKDRGAFGGEQVRHKYSWESSAMRLEEILQSCQHIKVGTACRPLG
jgi:glycosyltransferase involved in cell wall biosynthesis